MMQSTPHDKARSATPAVLGAALVVGVVGNLMAHASGGPGVAMTLFFVALAGALAVSSRAVGQVPAPESWIWIGVAVALSWTFVLRASPPLQVAAFLAAAAALSFPAFRSGRPWMRGSGISEYLESVAGAGGWALAGAAPAVFRSLGPDPGGPGGVRRTTAGVLRGLVLAAPLLLVFGALFASADPFFADLLSGLAGSAAEDWASHIVMTGILTWLALGFLWGFLRGTRLRHLVEDRVRAPSLGILEVAVALGLVILLFGAFVGVQFHTLFGGAALVEATPGLTHAAHTREGFGQLALASGLVLPLLLVTDWLLRDPTATARRIFRTLGVIQLLLLALVVASAFQRVLAYQAAYGLTESRLYGSLFLGWLVMVGVGFGVTVLRGYRERFAFPALVAAFVLVFGAALANPDAWIARTNLARTAGGAGVGPTIDVLYLGSLSADAVPTLLTALPRLDPEARCLLARRLLERWEAGGAPAAAEPQAQTQAQAREPEDWRSWNLAVARARAMVNARATDLRSFTGSGEGCPAAR